MAWLLGKYPTDIRVTLINPLSGLKSQLVSSQKFKSLIKVPSAVHLHLDYSQEAEPPNISHILSLKIPSTIYSNKSWSSDDIKYDILKLIKNTFDVKSTL